MPTDLTVNLSFLMDKPTGISNYALNVLPHLKHFDVTLFSAKQYQDFKCHLISDQLTPDQGVIGHVRRLIWTQFQLPYLCHNLNSQLLFSPVPEAPLYSDSCRFVVMFHDLIPLRFPNYYSPLTYYHKYYVPEVLHQSKHIICNSKATADDIINFFGIRHNKITPIPLALNHDHFRDLKLPSKNYFLYLGRQDPHKNLHRLVAAFAGLQGLKEYELWLVGPQDKRYTPLLKQQAAELEISHLVKFIDYVNYDDLITIINQSIAMVFPSLWEGFGFPVLEAMACGIPVITSDIASLPEICGEAAIMIDPYDIASITAAMQSIVNDPSKRQELSRAGLARAKLFTWQRTGYETAEVLRQFV